MCDSMAEIVVQGNTPTGVGKTLDKASVNCLGWKHPHGRGEDATTAPMAMA